MRTNKDGSIDKRSNNGGNKNAGRKTKAEEMGLKDTLEKHMPFDELIKLIAKEARDGNWAAQKELFERYAGKVADKSIIKQETTLKQGVDIADILANSYGESTNKDKPDISSAATE